MRTRSTPTRVQELSRWIKRHKDASVHEFIRDTGGTRSQYYHARIRAGLGVKNPVLSDAMKKASVRKKIAKAKEAILKTPNGDVILKMPETETKDLKQAMKQMAMEEFAKPTATEVAVEGNTPDFIWYEIDLLQRKLGDISARLAHVMKVSQTRDADQKKMMRQLISENTELRVNNNSLTQQVAELTEMINGSPV